MKPFSRSSRRVPYVQVCLGDSLLKKLRLARFRVSFAENVAFSVMERAFEGRVALSAFIENSDNA